MCGSCEGRSHSKANPWLSSHLPLVLFVAALVALTLAGLVLRLRSDGGASASGCSHLLADSTVYQTAVTRDLHAGLATLVSDTNHFVTHARAKGGVGCVELRAFARSARSTLRPVCAPCADVLVRAFDRRA